MHYTQQHTPGDAKAKCNILLGCRGRNFPLLLQAHDFEAYQELLRSEPGAAGAGTGAGAEERYEAVSKFLADTEEYIHKLAGKVRA